MQSDRSLEQAEKVLRREVSSNGQLRSTRAGKLAQARIHDAKAPARAAARSSQPLSSAGRQDMTLAEALALRTCLETRATVLNRDTCERYLVVPGA